MNAEESSVSDVWDYIAGIDIPSAVFFLKDVSNGRILDLAIHGGDLEVSDDDELAARYCPVLQSEIESEMYRRGMLDSDGCYGISSDKRAWQTEGF